MPDNKIKTALREATISSMKEGKKEVTTTLRMFSSEIKKEEIDNKKDLNEEEVISIVQKLIKQRKDSFKQFKDAGRDELAEKEAREIKILEDFLPEQMTEDEINSEVKKTISDLNAESMQDMGKVMGALKEKLSSKADMGLVSSIVKDTLS
ncbi:MAG: GatB/YqeY domain-containing protein [Gammaproteobacteria bacterium]